MEREVFLERVRAATATTVLPPHPATDPGLLVADLGEADLLALFTARVEEVDGVVHRVADDGDIGQRVVEIAVHQQIRSFMVWDELRTTVGERLTGAGLAEISGEVGQTDRLAHQLGYMDLGIGVTGAEAGLAESGTVVLRSGPGRPRMASVIPLVHVAILRADRIHRSLSHWAAEAATEISDAANVVLITGPSRTADIEQHINVGVHGPRAVHIVVVG